MNVEDLASNPIVTSTHPFLYFVPATPNYKEVVINEIFADPSPQIGLPAGEFIELYNASTSIFDLNGWTISDASSTATLSSYVLQPGEYVIIADDDFTFDFSIYSNVLLVTSLPSLNNASDDVGLEDDLGNTIDFVSYSDAWYQDDNKDDGGYSLELINPTLPCSNANNWIASNDASGGTPGQENSVYDLTPDTNPPAITTTTVNSSLIVEVCFDETLDTSSVNLGGISVDQGNTVTGFNIDLNFQCLTLILANPLDTGITTTFSFTSFLDCSGNSFSGSSVVVLPHIADSGDLIINEILFNPVTGGDDFVEVYNNSTKYIDLFGWHLANWDDGYIDNIKTIDVNFVLNPGEFAVLTKDSNNIKTTYINSKIGRFVEMATLPTYSNDSGSVYLLLPSTDTSVSDAFHYDEDMHFGLLNDPDGISLERIDYDRASSDNTNWHSAAEAVGWATPGYENSQYVPGTISADMVSVTPEIFSPDNNGIDDVVNIAYTLEEPGYVGNITIFDSQGRTIKSLVQSDLLASEGTYSWDGTNNENAKARVGIYIVYFEVFNLNGDVSSVKKTCVLATQF